MKILVVEDEVQLADTLAEILKRNKYNVDTVFDGDDGLEYARTGIYDCILLDIMLPVRSGTEIVQILRQEKNATPIMLLTAKEKELDKVVGLDCGADDYMVKPVDFEELSLRIKALLRRYRIATERKITVGGTVLTYDTLTVSNEKLNLTVTLQKKEFLILYKLFSYPEKTFSKGQLYDEFWGLDNFGDVDAVKVYVSKIRSAIEPFPEIDIATVRGIGYRGIKNE